MKTMIIIISLIVNNAIASNNSDQEPVYENRYQQAESEMIKSLKQNIKEKQKQNKKDNKNKEKTQKR